MNTTTKLPQCCSRRQTHTVRAQDDLRRAAAHHARTAGYGSPSREARTLKALERAKLSLEYAKKAESDHAFDESIEHG